MSARDDFPRSTCACDTCRAGCYTQPGMCGIGDVRRIAEFLGPADEDAFLREHFCASDGALVARINEAGAWERFRIPTIVPQQRADGRCVFLEDDGLCRVHPVAPIGCSHCDTHTPRAAGGADVVHVSLHEIMESPTYSGLAASLREAGLVARPLAQRKMAFAALEAEIREKQAATGVVTPDTSST